MALADLRREYNLAGLRRADLNPDPIVQFQKWFDESTAKRTAGRLRKLTVDINAVTLATADKSGRPSARVVLLKGVDSRGFIFFSNYDSRKGHELAENPYAALVFYWADHERQVTVAGKVTKLSQQESEAYFKSRPKGSRLAAWTSKQSEPIENRAVLEEQWKRLAEKYPDENVPMPPYWGGYVVSPDRVEFWQGRPSRLHDRFRYLKQPDSSWRIDRLSP